MASSKSQRDDSRDDAIAIVGMLKLVRDRVTLGATSADQAQMIADARMAIDDAINVLTDYANDRDK